MMNLKDKVAIVTGGATGIGKACAQRLAQAGGKVVIIGRNDQQGAAAEEELRSGAAEGGEAFYVKGDVSQTQDVRQAIDAAVDRWGRLDIVVNNAAIMTHDRVTELADEDWDQVLGVNLRAVFLFAKYGAPRMGAGSSIINISSVHAAATGPGNAAYCASKGGMEALTRALSLEFFHQKIRVNCLRLGAIDTGMLWNNPAIKSGQEKIQPDEVGKPEHVAETVAFLASEGAAFINGAIINVDGSRLSMLGSLAK